MHPPTDSKHRQRQVTDEGQPHADDRGHEQDERQYDELEDEQPPQRIELVRKAVRQPSVDPGVESGTPCDERQGCDRGDRRGEQEPIRRPS